MYDVILGTIKGTKIIVTEGNINKVQKIAAENNKRVLAFNEKPIKHI